DLANDLGNLLNRSLGMLNKYCGGILPPILGKNIPDENTVKQIANVITYRFPESYKSYKFDLVCEDALSLVRSCNKFIDDSAPWSLYKKGEQKEVEKILYILLESVRFSAFILAPIIPNISNKI
ncbi:MAG: methionine--tRNA ligase, partial [Bacteroidetes bacterium]|nr:methionine--tRNA ligase [Bacteroidota bacterium]